MAAYNGPRKISVVKLTYVLMNRAQTGELLHIQIILKMIFNIHNEILIHAPVNT